MRNFAKTIAIATIIATPAAAQPITLYDSRNVLIGTMLYTDLPTHSFKGVLYSFSADRVGLVTDLLKLYTSPDCSGQPYDQNPWDAIYAPPYAYADENNDLWGASNSATPTITVGSYYASWTKTCYKGYWGSPSLPAAPFVVIDSTVAKTWKEPFTPR